MSRFLVDLALLVFFFFLLLLPASEAIHNHLVSY